MQAEWIGTISTKRSVDIEILGGSAELFELGLKIARELLPNRRSDINHVTVKYYRTMEATQEGRCVIHLDVCAFQRF